MLRLWAVRLVRRQWRATLILGLLVGLAAGAALTAWGAARRTSSAFDAALAAADPPLMNITFCPPELERVDAETIWQCFTYLPVDELAVLRDLPEVEAAALGMFRGAAVAPVESPDATLLTPTIDMDSAAIHHADGQQILIEGRWFDEGAADEIVLNEAAQEASGLEVGDEVIVTTWSVDEMGSLPPANSQLHGPQRTARVVGISRGILDLSAATANPGNLDLRAYRSLVPDGPGFQAVFVRARPGVTADEVEARLAEAVPDAKFSIAPATSEAELDPIREAIDYEAQGARILAALLGLAAVVFALQAAARQSRREWEDLPTLHALGLTHRQAATIASMRGAVTGALAAVVALTTAIVASPIGPVGVARRTELSHSMSADGLVLAVGAVATLLVVVAGTALFLRSRPAGARPAGESAGLLPTRLHPTAAAGVGMARGQAGRNVTVGAALIGIALATATTVGAAGLVGALDGLYEHPARYGAPWDLSIGARDVNQVGLGPAATVLAEMPVDAAAGIVGSDLTVSAGERETTAWFQAFAPVEGFPRSVAPPLIEGRPPAAPDEVTLGTVTMSEIDVELGEVIELTSLTNADTTRRVTVVGTTMVNDNFETSPGRGGVATLELIQTLAPEATPDPHVFSLLPGSDVDAARERLEAVAPGTVFPPMPQAAVLNVNRVRTVPYILAAVVALLAVASLAHALVLSVRRHRRPLAVLKSIGFTRGQVRQVVAVYASIIAVAALVIGVPLGVIAGRWGWRMVARRLGVLDVPVTPWLAVAVAVVGVIALVNLVAFAPARRAARTRTATALRAE